MAFLLSNLISKYPPSCELEEGISISIFTRIPCDVKIKLKAEGESAVLHLLD